MIDENASLAQDEGDKTLPATADSGQNQEKPETDTSADADVSNDDAELLDEEDSSKGVDDELKTVRKALEKRNRYINNQRQRISDQRQKIGDLEAQIKKLQDGYGKDKPQAPELDKFDSALDFLKADTRHELKQELAEMQHKQKLELLEQQKAIALEEQSRIIEQQVVELAQTNPDFKKVVSDNVRVFQSMPEHINGLLTDLENGHIAAYALAKEGRLQSIYSMPPHIAAAHLVNAEIRGQQYLLQAAKPRKTAPEPIGAIKGGKSSTPSVSELKGQKLLKWIEN